MNTLSKCPAVDDLMRLAVSGGTDREIEEMAAHLEECETCGAALDVCIASDPGLSALRSASDGELPHDEAVREVTNRLRNLRPAADTARARGETLISGANDTSSGGGPPTRTGIDITFLAPPQQAGELGRLGNYRVLKTLGMGGMGVVFLAEDLLLHRKVALKTMLPTLAENSQAKERFLREARAAAAIEHEHVVAIYQVGEDRGVPFLAMPFLKGESLQQKLEREGKLPVGEALRIAVEMAEGLAAAQERELIHRDIKPANVWLEGTQAKVKLLDFGLARAQSDAAQLTQSGAILGTPAFMAPEQARGEKLDGRADLFSLGAVLYLMLTGRRPFEGENTITVLTALALHNPAPPVNLCPELPGPISQLTMRLLSKQPEERPATARDAVQELRALQLRPSAQPFATSVEPARPAVAGAGRLSRKVLVTALALGLAGVALAGGYLIHVKTDRGEIVIDSQDESIEVTVKQSGREPVVVVLDKNTQRSIELRPGDGEIEAKELPDGLRFKTQRFELKRGQQPVFTAEMLLAKAGGQDPAPKAPTHPAVAPVTPVAKLVYVETPEFTAWKTKVAALPAEEQIVAVTRKLHELNPEFDGRVAGVDGNGAPKIENGVVTELFVSVYRASDISPVRALQSLRVLEFRGDYGGNGPLTDLSPLQGMPQRVLRVSGTRISDLSALHDVPLTGLEVSNNPNLSDLSPLKGMKLTWLICAYSKVSDLSPLQGMPLEYLDCRQCRIKDFSPLQKSPLQKLVLGVEAAQGQAEVWETLRSVKSLTTIHRRGDTHASETPADKFFAEIPARIELERVIKQLRELNPDYDGAVKEATFQRGQVAHVRIDSNFLTDVSPLRELKGLTSLGLAGWRTPESSPGLSDISPLAGLPLKGLHLEGQPVKDLTPLKGMPLEHLNVAQSKVEDLSPLKGMPLIRLYLHGAPVLDLAPLAGIPLQELHFSFRPDIQTEVLSTLKSLQVINFKQAKAFFEDLPTELEVYAAVKQLQELNRVEPHSSFQVRVEKALVELIWFEAHSLVNIEPLKALKSLTILKLFNSPVADLSPLKGLPLTILEIPRSKAADLSPLKGMPLTVLNIGDAPVTDLSPLTEVPLAQLDFKKIELERDGKVLRSIKTLQRINGQPAAEFLKGAP